MWVPSGRWGPRRVRTTECAGILAAEMLYHALVCDSVPLRPGWSASLSCTVGAVEFSNIRAEVISNAVWRRGRLFLRCPACDRRATRLYVPIVNREHKCRRCWGLSYPSQEWSYRSTGWWGAAFGSPYRINTDNKRDARRREARERLHRAA